MAESLRQALGADLEVAVRYTSELLKEATPSFRRRVNVFLTPCMIAALLHRLAHAMWQRNLLSLAGALSYLNLLINRIDIHPACSIAGGLYIPHPTGILFRAHAGRNLAIFSAASVCDEGHTPPAMWTRMGEDVWVGAGARVTGCVHVGDHARIGPGAILCSDLPANTIAYAPPVGEPQ